jgi:hypothetical protein
LIGAEEVASMYSTGTGDPGPSSRSQATVRGGVRARRGLTLAAVVTAAVLGPCAYAAPAGASGAGSHGAVTAKKHKKPKHKCKKGFVYQHGRCVASSHPVY